MKKKYLKTPEEILALKDTDTKIYIDGLSTYYQYIGGVLCRFHEKHPPVFNCGVELNGLDPLYILVEEPVNEATDEDIGKLCKFWSEDSRNYMVGILCEVDFEEGDDCPYCMECFSDCWFEHCHPLTPAEVAKLTGYKVEE